MVFGKGNNTIVLREWFWHFVGMICHTILEGKSTGIQTWLLVKPFLPVLLSLTIQRKLRPRLLKCTPAGQGEAKIPFVVTNPAETMDVSPTVQTLAVVSTLCLMPSRASDSAWCLSQPVLFPCGLCGTSDTRRAEVPPVLLSEGLNGYHGASSHHLEKALPVGAENGTLPGPSILCSTANT